MDCRKWLVLAVGLTLGGAGCVTQQQNSLSDKTTTTVWTPLSMFQKETKRMPKVETCLEGGQMLEKQAMSDKLSAPDKEEMLNRARKAYQQALDTEPNNPQALTGLAHVYADLLQADRALETYEKAVKVNPKNARVWAELGRCHFQQNHYDKASEAFQKAVDTDPDERAYAKHLSLSLAMAGREKESIQVLTKLYGDAQAHFKYALILKKLEQPEKARQHLETALQRDPMLRPAEQLLAQLTPGAPRSFAPAADGPIVNISFKGD